MTGELLRVMVCPPEMPGGMLREEGGVAGAGISARSGFCSCAAAARDSLYPSPRAGAEVVQSPAEESLTLDAVYAHDASLATDYGMAVLMNPGKKNRVAEARAHAEFCGRLGIPVFGEIELPGHSEAGDIVWLDSQTLLIGNGYRTNLAGIEQMRRLLSGQPEC
jgi:N-dimethylarginine dimethylaminohydrolase